MHECMTGNDKGMYGGGGVFFVHFFYKKLGLAPSTKSF